MRTRQKGPLSQGAVNSESMSPSLKTVLTTLVVFTINISNAMITVIEPANMRTPVCDSCAYVRVAVDGSEILPPQCTVNDNYPSSMSAWMGDWETDACYLQRGINIIVVSEMYSDPVAFKVTSSGGDGPSFQWLYASDFCSPTEHPIVHAHFIVCCLLANQPPGTYFFQEDLSYLTSCPGDVTLIPGNPRTDSTSESGCLVFADTTGDITLSQCYDCYTTIFQQLTITLPFPYAAVVFNQQGTTTYPAYEGDVCGFDLIGDAMFETRSFQCPKPQY